jgi:hypothetical protein
MRGSTGTPARWFVLMRTIRPLILQQERSK